MTYQIKHSKTHDTIELIFDGKPSQKIRSVLKELRFRWHSQNNYWFGKADEGELRTLLDGFMDEPIERSFE